MTLVRLGVVAALAIFVAAPASAACRDDLVSVSQTVDRTRTELAGAVPAAKCAAYRQHIAALGQVRDVFARCDTGASKGKNAAQVKATIADLTKQMRASCRQ